MNLCPACDRPLTGTQQTCSADCAAAEVARQADEEMARAEAVPGCTYCGEEIKAEIAVCVDCTELRDKVFRVVTMPTDAGDMATRIMRLFFRGTATDAPAPERVTLAEFRAALERQLLAHYPSDPGRPFATTDALDAVAANLAQLVGVCP